MYRRMIHQFWSRVALGGTLTALLIASAGCGTGQQALTRTEVYEMAKLATVMVVTDFKSEASVPEAQFSPSGLQTLKQELAVMVNSGQVANNRDAITHAMIDLLVANPDKYLEASSQRKTMAVEMVSEGSGFFVTPDGYLITNAHVVAPGDAEIKQGFAQEAMQNFVTQDVQDTEKSLAQQGVTLTDDEVQALTKADEKYCAETMQLGPVDTSSAVELGAAVPGVAVIQQGTPASVVKAGTPTPGKDVAILKVEGKQNLPTLPLGDNSSMKGGDSLYVVGYPGDATFLSILAKGSQVEPTLTVGVVSRQVQMQAGWTALQTDAAVQHGNSGGPVLNTAGQVVGLATWGTPDPQTGTLEAGENFAVPTDLVKEFLQQVNVTPKESMTSTLYRQAVTDYDQQHYKQAVQIFQEINTLLPGNPFVQAYVTNSQSAIMQGKDRSGPAWWAWVLYILAALVAAALIVAGVKGRLGPLMAAAGGLPRRLARPKVHKGGSGSAQDPEKAADAPAKPAVQTEDGAAGPETPALSCSGCGAPLAAGAHFCADCGTPVPRHCSRCGTPAEEGQAFCGTCGSHLE